ncbi:MAG: biopolymer transporter ExbD [Rickettsia sp.]|nr:biopolymer transporter ExbD [Rickettsia sp.]
MKKSRFYLKTVPQINVTPIVDVMLVLLVIFMLTTPMLINGVDINLPKADTKTLSDTNDHLVITINNEGKIFLHETEFSHHNLKQKLEHLLKQNTELKILIRGDHKISYGNIMEIISILYKLGATNLSLVSELEE